METTGEVGGEPKRTVIRDKRDCQGQTGLRGTEASESGQKSPLEVIGDLRQSIFPGDWSQIREVLREWNEG